MSDFISWFELFLEEKNLPYASWVIEDEDGLQHIIDNMVVIEHIKIAPKHEQSKIKDMIVKIDFHNGNVNHFFEHLAKALVHGYNSKNRGVNS